jgi:hypothetical protein
MALIANINGKPVYSDKQLSAVTGSRVRFTDGSWCDVRTGDVHNNGAGYINIGGSDTGSNAKKVTEGPRQFATSALELRGFQADVNVEPHDARDIEYTITGPANLVKAIRTNVRGNTLVVDSDGSGSAGDNVTISGGGTVIRSTGRNVAVSGGGVSIGRGSIMSNFFGGGDVTTIIGGGGSIENEVKITIKVPYFCPITSKGVAGSVVIGDTGGSLSAKVSASASVRAGRVTHSQLKASSSGFIRVRHITGSATVDASSSGTIKVDDGEMTQLMATASSSGDVNVGGTASTAMLNASSSGRVRVDHVKSQPMVSESSSGSARVRRIG